ncbi:MAG: hypothetical protein KGO81_03275 [Bacteroidota bacterium]|nr:hypothetical protein [Bacteroidota bacterium]
MNTLSLNQMENLTGGMSAIQRACKIYAGAQAIYGWGILAEAWNPVGATATGIMLLGDAACYFLS